MLMRAGARIALIIAALAAVPTCLAVAFIHADKRDCSAPDWRAWRSAKGYEGETPTRRQRDADKIIGCKLLAAERRADVRVRLGPPDRGTKRSANWRWVTGPARGVPIDSEELVISFVAGRVTGVRLTTG